MHTWKYGQNLNYEVWNTKDLLFQTQFVVPGCANRSKKVEIAFCNTSQNVTYGFRPFLVWWFPMAIPCIPESCSKNETIEVEILQIWYFRALWGWQCALPACQRQKCYFWNTWNVTRGFHSKFHRIIAYGCQCIPESMGKIWTMKFEIRKI